MEKLLIPAQSDNLFGTMDDHFGRAGWYLVVDTEGTLHAAVPGNADSHHAGIFRMSKELAFQATLTSHMGPGAWQKAQAQGVKIYMLEKPTQILDAIRQYKDGKARLLDSGEDLSCGGNCGH